MKPNPGLSLLLLATTLQTAAAISTPTNFVVAAGDQSVVIHWNPNSDVNLAGYRVYRSTTGSGGPFTLVTPSLLVTPSFCDVSSSVVNGQTNYYEVSAVDSSSNESAPSAPLPALPQPFASNDQFLDYVQQCCFDYFWYAANPVNGLVPDRTAIGSPCSIAAQGFGLTAIGIGIDHGWISRAQGAARVLTTLNTFYNGPQGTNTTGIIGYRGWFYHFLDMNTATRVNSSTELSSIDSVLFLGGVLYAKQYFNGTNANETSIRTLADAIFNRVDWTWMAQGTAAVAMGWFPESGFIQNNWVGYNEAMVLYILGLGTATNPLPASSWTVWTSGYNWGTFYGQTYVAFAPLFGHEFSHCWVDFRHIADSYMSYHGSTYFENSRRAALAEVAYSSTAPFTGYSSTIWGLTACDGPPPTGYTARGLPPAGFDDGTIAPTAAGGATCFSPEYSLPTLKAFYDVYRTNLWTAYAFRDAFNLGQSWYDTDELGLDQGPIIIMIENYRTARVWQVFMKNPEVQRGLQRAGFANLPEVALQIQPAPAQNGYLLSWNAATQHYYQVEYSPDLVTWMASPGLVQATNAGIFTWLDSGPYVTLSSPTSAPTRFYRVFDAGEAPPPGQPQLLLNSSFETAGAGGIYTATNWTITGAANRETWAAHSGSYGMAHEWWVGTSSSFYQEIAATPGLKYTLSAFCLDDAATVVTSVYTMKLLYYDGSHTLLRTDNVNLSPLVSNIWQQMNFYGTPAPANTATVRVLFDAANMVSGETLKIDDVSLTGVP